MEELFTLTVLLYILSIIAVLPLRGKYRASITVGHVLTGMASISLLAFTVVSLPEILKGKAIEFTYNLGVLNIPFHIDGLSLILCLVLGSLGLATSIYSPRYMEFYERFGRGWLYVVLYSTFVLSMVLIVTTSNFLWFVFFWEVMTFTSYVLMVWENDEEYVRKAGWKYFVTMHLASTLPLIIALAMLYAKTGSINGLNFDNLSTLHLGWIYYMLFLTGFGSKAGVVPLHFWLPDAHPAAPSNVSALLSGAMIKVAVYGLVRMTCFVLKPTEAFGYIVAILGTITLTVGTLYALKQTDAKRLLAYHSVGQMGYIWLGIGAGIALMAKGGPWAAFGAIAMAAGLYHLVNHAIFKGLLFLSAGSVLYRTHTRELNILGGLAKLMPLTALFTFIAAMSIAGEPPFNGFMSKWMIYQGTFLSNDGLLVFCGIMALFISAATLASFVKFYTTAFGGRPTAVTENAEEVPSSMLIGKGFLAALCLLFGLIPSSIIPLLLSPGKALTGVDLSKWISTKYWLVTIRAPGMPSGGETYFNPWLLVGVLGVLAVTMLVSYPNRPKKIVKVWTTGEPVKPEHYKLRAMHYYGPFEEYIHGLYRSGKVLGEWGSKVCSNVAMGYLVLGRTLLEWAKKVGSGITSAGRWYIGNMREVYLDETVASPLIQLIQGLGTGFEEVSPNYDLLMTLTAIVLAIMIIILAGGLA